MIRTANEGWFRPSVVISVFVGWKVSVTSFEIGARVYTIGPPVVASDHATSTCELRVTLGRPERAMATTPIGSSSGSEMPTTGSTSSAGERPCREPGYLSATSLGLH